MKLRRLILDNFMGVRHAEYEFSDRTVIKAKNGVGKSTIATAFYFLLVNKSYAMVDNPPVRNRDAIDEIVVTVTGEFEFDGKPVEIQKSQKLKRSKSGTVSLTNSYMVNSVPKSEKDFKVYLEDLGVDFSRFLQCSHPNVMLSGINNKKERDQLRNMLFEMADDVTDADIAESDPELAELSKLLANYDTEEIAAMQNATLRKIRENYGKEGELLRSKIEGLEAGKVEVDVKAVNAKIEELNKQKDDINAQIDVYQSKLKAVSDISSGLLDKRFRLQQMESDAVADDIRKRSEMDKDIIRLESQINRLDSEIEYMEKKSNELMESGNELQKRSNVNSETLENYKKTQFDVSSAVCPTCGRELIGERLEKAKNDFETKKQKNIRLYQEKISQQELETAQAFQRATELSDKIRKSRQEREALDKSLKELTAIRKELGDVEKPDMSGNEEYQKLLADIADDEDVLTSSGVIQDEINTLKQEEESVILKIDELNFDLHNDKRNKYIDRQIAEARQQQIEYEQSKANAEMIIDQLKTLNMKKNTMLQKSVNKHFNLVEWVLYVTQKNGDTKDACIPTIDGKRFGESMNNALEVMAKLDVINGVQGFYGYDYPVFLDNAECLDSESKKAIKSDHQLIMLCVSDDKELVFEKKEDK